MPAPSSSSRQRVTVSIAWLYVLSGLGITLLCIGSITAIIVLRPTVDNTPLVVVIIGFASTTLASLIAALKSQEAKHLTREVGYRVDGRLSQLVEEKAKSSRAEGRVEGAAAVIAAETPEP